MKGAGTEVLRGDRSRWRGGGQSCSVALERAGTSSELVDSVRNAETPFAIT